jgi:hypothetical protein
LPGVRRVEIGLELALAYDDGGDGVEASERLALDQRAIAQ